MVTLSFALIESKSGCSRLSSMSLSQAIVKMLRVGGFQLKKGSLRWSFLNDSIAIPSCKI